MTMWRLEYSFGNKIRGSNVFIDLKKINSSGLHMVFCSNDFYFSFVFHVLQYRTFRRGWSLSCLEYSGGIRPRQIPDSLKFFHAGNCRSAWPQGGFSQVGAVIFPSFTLSMADLIAPQCSCPKTTISLAPESLQPYSRLPKISSLEIFPATRATNKSPMPQWNTSSTRHPESRRQDKITAAGYCHQRRYCVFLRRYCGRPGYRLYRAGCLAF